MKEIPDTIPEVERQRFGDDSGVLASLLGMGEWVRQRLDCGRGRNPAAPVRRGWRAVDTQTSRTLSAVTGQRTACLRWAAAVCASLGRIVADHRKHDLCNGALGIGQVGADLLSVGEGYCMTRRSGGV